ncbi:MAG: hypothetical protein LBJ87_14645 [bacterium]|jgi:hypothetical protein|nr:hypothetical protein [bacterium]
MTDRVPPDVELQIRLEDRAAEREEERASVHVMCVRWHWTLDESNPQRVSFGQYAKLTRKAKTTIHKYARGYAVWMSGKATTPGEALERATMSEDRQEQAAAEARERGVSLAAARRHPEARTSVHRTGTKPEFKVDASGRAQPARKRTGAELTRRRDTAKALWDLGYSNADIADYIGVSRSQVHQDLKVYGVKPERRAQRPVPPDWRPAQPQVPEETRRWRQPHWCWQLPAAAHLAAELQENNGRSAFAWLCWDAHRAGDQEWLGEAAAHLRALMAYLQQMVTATEDPTLAKVQATEERYRDDIGEAPTWRPEVVQGAS